MSRRSRGRQRADQGDENACDGGERSQGAAPEPPRHAQRERIRTRQKRSAGHPDGAECPPPAPEPKGSADRGLFSSAVRTMASRSPGDRAATCRSWCFAARLTVSSTGPCSDEAASSSQIARSVSSGGPARGPLEGMPAGQQLVENHAKGIDVGCCRDAGPAPVPGWRTAASSRERQGWHRRPRRPTAA